MALAISVALALHRVSGHSVSPSSHTCLSDLLGRETGPQIYLLLGINIFEQHCHVVSISGTLVRKRHACYSPVACTQAGLCQDGRGQLVVHANAVS